MEQELRSASYEGNLRRVEELLSEGVNPNAKNEYGFSPLWQASR